MKLRARFKWVRFLAAGASSGCLVGLVCGLYLIVRNPVGGHVQKLLLLTLTTFIYFLALTIPLALALVLIVAVIRTRSAERAIAIADDPGRLLALALATMAIPLSARQLVSAYRALNNGYGWRYAIGEIINAALLFAIVIGAAIILAVLWRRATAKLGARRATMAALGLLAALSGVIVLFLSPSPSRAIPSTGPDVSAEKMMVGFPNTSVALIGFDGLEADVLQPLIDAGKMPNFAELRQRGVFRLLETLPGGLSPPIWTTIATGVAPIIHGIHGFVTRRLTFAPLDLRAVQDFPRGLGARTVFSSLTETRCVQERLFSPRDRQAPVIWTLTSLVSVEACVVDWLGSWPSERISGTLVSDRAFFVANNARQDLGPGSEDLHDEDLPVRLKDYESDTAETLDLCFPEPECLSLFSPADGPYLHPGEESARFHVAENAFYLDIAQRLLRQKGCQLFVFYSHLPDFVNHRMTPPELDNVRRGIYATPTEQLVRDIYVEVDRTLGILLDLLPLEVSVLVISDHGVEVVQEGLHQDVSHRRGPPGVFFFRSSQGARPELPATISLYDVAPTVLALLGLPITTQMAGTVHRGLITAELENPGPTRVVDAAEVMALSADHLYKADVRKDATDEDQRERLRSLGYIE